MDEHRFYVITGASGGGKSTLVAALKELGFSTIKVLVPERAEFTLAQVETRA